MELEFVLKNYLSKGLCSNLTAIRLHPVRRNRAMDSSHFLDTIQSKPRRASLVDSLAYTALATAKLRGRLMFVSLCTQIKFQLWSSWLRNQTVFGILHIPCD